MTTWQEHFAEVVRQQMPALAQLPRLTDDVRLDVYGLDSLRRVRLLVALENGLGVSLPDELLVPATFETLGSLRTALRRSLEENES